MKIHFCLVLACLISCAYAQQNFWEPTNGPYGADINTILAGRNGLVFAGLKHGGLYRSTNNGEAWKLIAFEDKWISSLAMNKRGDIFCGDDYNLFRSTDNGNTWMRIDSSLKSFTTTSILIDSLNTIFIGGYLGGLYKSTDNGDTWSFSGLEKYSVESLEMNSKGDMYAGCNWYGIYKSTDKGISWSLLNPRVSNLWLRNMIIDKMDNIYYGSEDGGGGIFKSSDDGVTWDSLQIDPLFTRVSAFARTKNNDLLVFLVDGTGAGKVYRTTDQGLSWNESSRGMMLTKVLDFSMNENGEFFAGSGDAGVYFSSDNGYSWIQKSLGFPKIPVEALYCNSLGDVFAGTSVAGVFRSTDRGDTWLQLSGGIRSSVTAIAGNSKGEIFLGASGFLYLSTDQGQTWTPIIDAELNGVDCIAIDSQDHIFVGSDIFGVVRSTTGGNPWFRVTDSKVSPVISITVDKKDQVFAGTFGGGVFRSTDTGDTWTQSGLLFSRATVLSFAHDSRNVLFGGTFLDDIYRSTDDGMNWVQRIVVDSLPERGSIYSIAIDRYDNVYIGGWGGVCFSSNHGDRWTELNSGLTGSRVAALVCTPSGYIYAATDEGVFRSVVPVTEVSEKWESLPSALSINQNHPNPFSESTTIRFQITDYGLQSSRIQISEEAIVCNLSSVISLKLYDLFGREVLDLTDRIQSASSVTIHRSDLPAPGMYFYRLQSGEQIVTKKMLLLE